MGSLSSGEAPESGVKSEKLSLPSAMKTEDRIRSLKTQGLSIKDEDAAVEFLEDVSWYRLKGYASSFMDGVEKFKVGASFDALRTLYEFDSELRRLLFGVIEKIEVSFRTRIVNFFSLKYGPLGYLKTENFESGNEGSVKKRTEKEEGSKPLNASEDDTDEQKNGHSGRLVDEIVRYINLNIDSPIKLNSEHKYVDVRIPFYEAAEFVSFGTLSKFYKDMKPCDRIEFRDENYKDIKCASLDSWFGSIGNIRNMCAHHDRVYGKRISAKPKIYKEKSWHWEDRMSNDTLFSILLCMKRFVKDDDWSGFVKALDMLLNDYPTVDMGVIGFSTDWRDELSNTIVW